VEADALLRFDGDLDRPGAGLVLRSPFSLDGVASFGQTHVTPLVHDEVVFPGDMLGRHLDRLSRGVANVEPEGNGPVVFAGVEFDDAFVRRRKKESGAQEESSHGWSPK